MTLWISGDICTARQWAGNPKSTEEGEVQKKGWCEGEPIPKFITDWKSAIFMKKQALKKILWNICSFANYKYQIKASESILTLVKTVVTETVVFQIIEFFYIPVTICTLLTVNKFMLIPDTHKHTTFLQNTHQKILNVMKMLYFI